MGAESSRAEAIMRREMSEQRVRVRVPLHLSARIFYSPEPGPEQVGLIRDISVSGLFFYSESQPRVQSPVRLVFTVQMSGREIAMVCEGTVVRVEPSRSKANGIAVRLSSFDFLPPAAA